MLRFLGGLLGMEDPAEARELSKELFNAAMHPESRVTIKRGEESLVKRRRDFLLGALSSAIERDGKKLYNNDERQACYSNHGSIYHRLHLREINDMDIYVILHGDGMTYEGEPLLPRTRSVSPGPNAMEFTWSGMNPSAVDPARTTTQWMMGFFRGDASYGGRPITDLGDSHTVVQRIIGMVEAAVFDNGKRTVQQTRGRRGAVLTEYGSRPKVSFDFIPVFVVRREGSLYNVLPDGNGGWEYNPTQEVMQSVGETHRLYPRDQQNRILGAKDIIKVLKVFKTMDDWETWHGVTSFVILYAVHEVLSPEFRAQDLNQRRLRMVVDKINEWIRRGGFKDPYTAKKLELRRPEIQTTNDTIRRLSAFLAPRSRQDTIGVVTMY